MQIPFQIMTFNSKPSAYATPESIILMGFPSPACHSEMDWSPYFPHFFQAPKVVTEETTGGGPQSDSLQRQVEILDIGCGFGGLLVALAPVMPDVLMLGKLPKA